MVAVGQTSCPICGGELRFYDVVSRILKGKGGKKRYISIRRLRCVDYGSTHRELTDDILPFKHYEAEIIRGVIEGLITDQTYGFEDYPCLVTMLRWLSQKILGV